MQFCLVFRRHGDVLLLWQHLAVGFADMLRQLWKHSYTLKLFLHSCNLFKFAHGSTISMLSDGIKLSLIISSFGLQCYYTSIIQGSANWFSRWLTKGEKARQAWPTQNERSFWSESFDSVFWLRRWNCWALLERREDILFIFVPSFFDITVILTWKVSLENPSDQDSCLGAFVFKIYIRTIFMCKIEQDVKLKCDWLQSWYFDFLSYKECSKVQTNHFFEVKNQNHCIFLITMHSCASWLSVNFGDSVAINAWPFYTLCFLNQ